MKSVEFGRRLEGREQNIPSLDGLRAVSIALVVCAHGIDAWARGAPNRWVLMLVNGGTGVAIFFGISGFLITGLLLREHARQGSISLPRFYARRALRILPAFGVYLAFCALVLAVPVGDLVRAGTFLSNYLPPQRGELAHTWSLSVEEQFYLFWPLVLAALGPRRGLRVAGGLLVAAPVLRCLTYFLVPGLRGLTGWMGHTRVDAIMIGCFLALLVHEERQGRLLRLALHRWAAAASAVVLFVGSPMLTQWFGGGYRLPLGYTLESLAVGSIIAWAVHNPGSVVGRFLNWRPVVHLGRISYSLYLWQQPVWRAGEWPWRGFIGLAAAEASFRLVEQPFLRLRALVMRERSSTPARHDVVVGALVQEPGSHGADELHK